MAEKAIEQLVLDLGVKAAHDAGDAIRRVSFLCDTSKQAMQVHTIAHYKLMNDFLLSKLAAGQYSMVQIRALIDEMLDGLPEKAAIILEKVDAGGKELQEALAALAKTYPFPR